MRYRRNLWLWILGLPLFLGVSAHWGFHFLVKERLAQLASQAPALGFRYQGLRTSLFGEILLEGVRLKPPGYAAPVAMDRLKLKGPAVPLYLLFNNPLVGFGPPRYFSLHLAGVRWPPASADARGVCEVEKGTPLRFFEALWREGEPTALEASYHYRSAPEVLEGEVSTRAGGAHAFDFSIRLVNVTPKGFRSGQLGTSLLAGLKVGVKMDPRLGRQLVRHCADAWQLAPAVFESRLASIALQSLKRVGLAADDGLEQALQRYFHDWGELEVELRPPVPMSVAFLPFIPAGQLQKKLGIALRIDGETVAGNYFQGGSQPLAELRAEETKHTAKRLSRPVSKGSRWRYRSVAVASLSRYLGHRVRLRARGEPPRQGILLKVAEGEAMVEQRFQGGTLTIPVPLQQLIGAEVFLPEKDRD